MKRIILLFFISAMLSLQAMAQEVAYSNHTIAKGETLSGLAKKYSTTVGDIMRLNGMHADSKLMIGQKIKIPQAGKSVPNTTAAAPVKSVTETAPKTVANTSPATAGIHIVKKGETLYSIGKKYGVSIEKLKLWNNIQKDNIEVGEVLAVDAKAIAEAQVEREAQQKQAVAPGNTEKAVVEDAGSAGPKAVVVPAAAEKAATDKKTATNAVAAPEIDIDTKNEVPGKQLSAAADGSDNFFSKDFSTLKTAGELKTIAGPSGIFKTASGWDDKKFYILMNDAPTGSVVKVKSASGNIIYAKVLWPIDDIKANEGLTFRISDAAASALGIGDQKFGLIVQYH
ncbi:MAG TPA: LysM peptidoglycan-binding domain-containing protein [Panacibacter sp.]|nr:LysM peptidoglycan-binding domain-containing protein [Panacibacter sp.]HNP44299.1 LysM peptidoglycan-binding domain-containing protein [Panacibacter sp.]